MLTVHARTVHLPCTYRYHRSKPSERASLGLGAGLGPGLGLALRPSCAPRPPSCYRPACCADGADPLSRRL